MEEGLQLHVPHLFDAAVEQRQLDWHDRLAELRVEQLALRLLLRQRVGERRDVIRLQRGGQMQARFAAHGRHDADAYGGLDQRDRPPAQ